MVTRQQRKGCFEDVEDLDRYVYHYTSRDTALEKILTSGQLMFNLLKNTNDPRESKSWWPVLSVDGGEADMLPEEHEAFQSAVREVPRLYKVFCATRDDRRFGPGWTHARMWAQYGARHQGICLVFERELLHDLITRDLAAHEAMYRGPVRYANPRPALEAPIFCPKYDAVKTSGAVRAISDHVERHHGELFLRKHLDWEAECEYRWVVRTPRPSPEFVSFEGALDSVILGPDSPKVYLPSLRPVCKKWGARILHMNWENGWPAVHDVGD